MTERSELKIDLHVHTNVSSPCSMIDPESMIRQAMETGLDALCVTEHELIEGAIVAQRLGREYGFKVFRGIEVYTELGDMLVYGLYRDAPGWRTPFDELLEMCRREGAVIAPAHPCRIPGELEKTHGVERTSYLLGHVDAVETHNGGCTPEGNLAARQLAGEHGLPGIGGSDAHHLFQVGRCHTVFEDEIESDEELVSAIRSGRYRGTCEPVR